MEKFRKLLYLLQLEEYQTERYFKWLQNHPLDELEERKDQLRWSLRMVSTAGLSLLLDPVIGDKRAIGSINIILNPIFRFLGELIVFLAKAKLKLYPKLFRIVITGSYGKTTFKERLAWVLRAKYPALTTPGNINTALGIAKTILKELKREHQILVVEAGAYKRGDIKKICRMVQPTWGVVTAIGWMHLERFKTLANIRRTKLEIVPFIKDKTKLFLPSKNHQFVNFDVVISEIAKQLGISPKRIDNRLKISPVPERRLIEKRINKNLVILDNSYNSNPLGFKRSLEVISGYRGYQKIVVTPGMVELGKKQFSLNKELAKRAAKVADIFVVVGQTNKEALLSGVREIKKPSFELLHLKKNEDLDKRLSQRLRPPTVILLENELPDHYS